MANEYLTRRPTSTGNRKVFTIAFWNKINGTDTYRMLFSCNNHFFYDIENAIISFYDGTNGVQAYTRNDKSSWYHVICAVDTTQTGDKDRVKIYINGAYQYKAGTPPTINFEYEYNSITGHFIGTRQSLIQHQKGQFSDFFFVDGQALTPDVFGFYKEGNGYISAGSTQATDFRPGQWVPKTPRVIKTEINRRGGFGVNGFYLPMNDSSNFGADFHCAPNSIITLKGEDLPQPRNGAPTTTDAYVSQLRTDPYAANLVLALPFVNGGLGTDGTSSGINTGFGDYSAVIKGSGSAKVGIVTGGVSIATTAGYYGSSGYFNAIGGLSFDHNTDFNFGSGDWTIETWRIRNRVGTTGEPYVAKFAGGASNADFFLAAQATGAESIYWYDGTNIYNITSASGICTSGQWDHIAAVRKGSTITLYVNGTAVGINTIVTYSLTNSSTQVRCGITTGTGSIYTFDGRLQDLRIYKGVAKYKGGFDVPKPYTPVGIGTWRAVPDCTANNFATWNPLDAKNASSISNGNLSTGIFSQNYGIRATVGVSTDKWYWEWREENASPNNHHGIWAVNTEMSNYYVGQTTDSWGIYVPNGNKRNNTSFDAYGSAFSQGDIGMCALDKTNGKIWWGKNGTWFASGNPASGSNEAFNNVNTVDVVSPTQLQYEECSYNFGQNPTFSGNTTAGTFTDSNGKGLFKYQPPSGFLALCEDNLPTPAIKNPGEYFKSVIYTGASPNDRAVTGIGFTPDLVWIKSRTQTYNHHIFDSVRGPARELYSNTTGAEVVDTTGLKSFDSDGFSIGSNAIGDPTGTRIAWCWRAGAGTTSTNTDGSIQSVVSVNQDAGFSIVSYTGTGSAATVGHGLGKAPKFIVIKNRDAAEGWINYHSSIPATQFLQLNSTNAVASNSGVFNDTAPTSSVFSIGNIANTNGSGNKLIAYCWAEIEGFSKFGSYVGNGNADGPFIYTGGRPTFVMIKSSTATTNWYIFDSSRQSTNPVTGALFPNTSDIETFSAHDIDFLSNGFKIRQAAGYGANNSGATYIYACFMESPFTTANAK